MDLRTYLQRAQQAEVFADVATDPIVRQSWEDIAEEYRRLARDAVGRDRASVSCET
jgi:hypothetical protein